MTNKLMRSHEDATIERFQSDPALATEYLAAIVTDGDENELRHARRLIAKSFARADHFTP
jgi:DNA-binding phage protein